MAKRLSNDVLDSIKAFAISGKGVVEIAEILTLSQPTVSKYMKSLGFKTDMSAADKKDEIVRLFADGTSINDISNNLGVSRPTVRKYLQSTGLTKTADELQFGKDIEKEMCDMYSITQNIADVAKAFNASDQGVRKVLLRNGATLRKAVKKELNTEPFRNLENDLPEEIVNFLVKVPKRTRPRYSKAVDLFNVIDTEEKAYWLGFIYADGGIYIGNTTKLYFGVKQSDKDILIKFCKFIGISEDSVKTVNRTVSGKLHASETLEVCSLPLCQSLVGKGVLPRKSLTLSPPSEGLFRDDLVRHFIRGYFDGDGGINADGSISVTGTLDIVEWVVGKFGDLAERKLSQKDLTKNTFTYRVGGDKAREVLDMLYHDCKVALDRKLSTYKSYAALTETSIEQ